MDKDSLISVVLTVVSLIFFGGFLTLCLFFPKTMSVVIVTTAIIVLTRLLYTGIYYTLKERNRNKN
jgi:MFS superfamily sulfate permease-like transporter